MPRKKMTNAILDANGGLDSQRALSTAHNILLNHDLQRPILYHVVITGGDIETYQAVIKKLIRRIRTKCRVEYFGAYEVAENRDGAHAHVFILIETRHNQPFRFLDIRKGGYLLKLMDKHKLRHPIHVSKPKNAMHGGQMFAVPVGDELLADCLKWCTYEYKKRSKEGVQRRETYFNSEFASNVAKRAIEKAKRTSRKSKPVPVPPPAALPAAEESIPETRTNGDDMQLTKAGFNYLATHYENCVDQGLNIVEIQNYLRDKGISRSLRQVRHELDNVFEFSGYVEAHPAPPMPDLAMFDAEVNRTPLRSMDSTSTLQRLQRSQHGIQTHRLDEVVIEASGLGCLLGGLRSAASEGNNDAVLGFR